MEKYIIDYLTGVKHVVEVADLDEAKKIAEQGIAYTQQSVVIRDEHCFQISRSYWIGTPPEEDDEVLTIIGGGFYQAWTY
jgi:hypothetical protein